MNDLLTLCEECHKEESDLIKDDCAIFIREVKRKFKLSRNIIELAEAVFNMNPPDILDVFTSALCEFLTSEKKLKKLMDDYMETLKWQENYDKTKKANC